MGLFPFLANDLGIDLGTANSLVFVRGRGLLIEEPSVVALDKATKRSLQSALKQNACSGVLLERLKRYAQ